jgi:cbb3-type cytochrome oxidase subunit 3
LIGIINLIFTNIISIVFFLICKKVCKNELVSFFASFFLLISRFSYYNINQVFGLMEALALIMSLLILYFLYEYINENKTNSYYLACLFYFLICYVHERYIILFPLFIYTIIIKKITNKTFGYYDIVKKIMIPSLCFILFFLVRFLLFKGRMLDGTGGTDATETFNIKKVIKYIYSQIIYIMGINNGEMYLNGINWESMSNIYKSFGLMIFGLMFLLIIVSGYLLYTRAEKRRNEYVTNIILYLMFIALCILSSSITIRVEMRWIYVSYAATLILFSYLIKILIDVMEKKNKIILWGGIATFCVFVIPLENYYRSNYTHLYYWPVMVASESLYERTYDKYGEVFWNKTLIVYCKEEFMTSENIRDILLPLNKNRYMDNFEVYVINNLTDVNSKYRDRDIVVLKFDSTLCKYTDITDIVKDYRIVQSEGNEN